MRVSCQRPRPMPSPARANVPSIAPWVSGNRRRYLRAFSRTTHDHGVVTQAIRQSPCRLAHDNRSAQSSRSRRLQNRDCHGRRYDERLDRTETDGHAADFRPAFAVLDRSTRSESFDKARHTPSSLSPGITRRARSQRPHEFAVRSCHGHIVDAGLATMHQSIVVELPLLIAMGTEPISGVVMPFVRKPHGNAVAVGCSDLLHEAVVQFLGRRACQQIDDGRPSLDGLGTVPPAAILRIGERSIGEQKVRGIARVPGILGHADLADHGFKGEGAATADQP